MNPRTHRVWYLACAAGIAGLLLPMAGCGRAEPGTYATPEEAVQALNEIIGDKDDRRTEEMFGPGSAELFRSGDEADDARAAQRVKELIAEKVAFEEFDETTRVALFGDKAWPFPIPLVKTGERWRFDTAAGREELLNRRIGYNELSTLASLHAYVDAQFEYFAQGRDGNRPAFAQRFRSSEGRQDGLYWEAAEGEPESPLGDLLAEAAQGEAGDPQPYHGYHYRILTSQGKNAAGGERTYLDAKGLMTTGFAAIAWPAKYGNSGVMTFLVNQRDIVFEKDLGAETEQAAVAIQSFDPDPTWGPTADSLDDVEDDGGSDGEGIEVQEQP